jgi:hypothetical protein
MKVFLNSNILTEEQICRFLNSKIITEEQIVPDVTYWKVHERSF